MTHLILLLLAVSKVFTIRIFAEERPSEVTITSSEGSYTVKASGNSVVVNGKTQSYFQQMGASRYSLTAGSIKRSYAGGFTFYASAGELIILNYIPEEAYLSSVVSSEMPTTLIEALKAQAILARTYVYKNMGNHDAGYDLLDSQESQVYKGLPVSSSALEAVRQTQGLVLGYKGEIAEVYYHSTCGGMILLPSDVWPGYKNKPYHRRFIDTICSGSPYYNWADTFRLDSLTLRLRLKKSPKYIRVIRDTVMSPVKGFVFYSPDSAYFDYQTVALSLGHKPKTRRFDVEMADTLLIFHCRGYGHSVGMCQFGAMALAREGENYRDILLHYFPGTEFLAVSSLPR